ncbi:MAG: DUF2380 domain-containing protein [Methylococcaceae bacterium]|jgi:hypothetical protein
MNKLSIILLLSLLTWSLANAETRIAVLDFELNDLTLAPHIPAEIQRTASLKILLENELLKAGYQLIPISAASQQQANAGVGYLFAHAELAAKLAQSVKADYIVLGRLHKPSFLFAYIMAKLVRTSDGRIIGNYIVESKGNEHKLTLKGIETLTVKIDHDLDQRYSPPAPNKQH